MNKKPILSALIFTALLSGCEGKGGDDINGDGKPDGIRGENGYCPPYSSTEKPKIDGYCYPG